MLSFRARAISLNSRTVRCRLAAGENRIRTLGPALHTHRFGPPLVGSVTVPFAKTESGFSGATMDQPAPARRRQGGRVDIMIVYNKIDRLTRSLADFAKIVEILDTKDASFVSVTQQFNRRPRWGAWPSTFCCPSRTGARH
jgi:hypothetical protein